MYCRPMQGMGILTLWPVFGCMCSAGLGLGHLWLSATTPPTAVAGARSLVLCNGRPGRTGSNGKEDERAGEQLVAWSFSSFGPQGALLGSCLCGCFLCTSALGIHFPACALGTFTCWGQVRSLLKCLSPFPLYLWNVREEPTLPPITTLTPTPNPTQPNQMLLWRAETCCNDLSPPQMIWSQP